MTIKDLAEVLDCKVIHGEEYLSREVKTAFASDLLSDVLTLQANEFVLLTGLPNLQAIRTAEMAEASCVVFVRNKRVSPEMIRLAQESEIAILECPYSMYRSCGLLYKAGLKPIY
jgi:serine kinase of HPr protein (carbohydrate metabolism regulator)